MALSVSHLVFDMDGVLVNTETSYHHAIIDTVAVYLSEFFGLKGPLGQVPSSVVTGMKQVAGGFNNDWDLTRALLRAIASGKRLGRALSKEGLPACVPTRRSGDSLSATEAIEDANLDALPNLLASHGGGPAAVEAAFSSNEDRIPAAWVFGKGDVRDSNVVERIFQEIYLGVDGFEKIYGTPAKYGTDKAGLIATETLMVPADLLKRLARHVPLGIATGRPKAEAEIALARAGLLETFAKVVTNDDCVLETERRGDNVSLSKPHPFPVLTALAGMNYDATAKGARFVFFGDLPDDLRAGRAARQELGGEGEVVGVCAGPKMRESLEALSPWRLVEGGPGLVELLGEIADALDTK